MMCGIELPGEPSVVEVAATSRELTTRRKPQGNWQFMNISKPTQTRDANFRRIVRENAARDHARNQEPNRIKSFRKIGGPPTLEKRSLSARRTTTKPLDDERVDSWESSCDDDSISSDSRRSLRDTILTPQIQCTRFRSNTPELLSWDSKVHAGYSKYPSPECYEGSDTNFNNNNQCSGKSSIKDASEMYHGTSIASPSGSNTGVSSTQTQSLLRHCK